MTSATPYSPAHALAYSAHGLAVLSLEPASQAPGPINEGGAP